MPGLNLKRLPPLSLYIHIPWCVRKCPYCDFNSHGVAGDIPEAAYINALIKDLIEDLPYVQDRPLESIFFGGGTPSLFSAAGITRILAAVKQHIPFTDNIEITLEANPGTIEQSRFAAYLDAGINRLSVGVQSFQDKHLESLGRIHSAADAIGAIETLKRVGFKNFNIDLMHGLPGQDVMNALADIEQAIALGPSHLSWYQLTIERNTVFFNKPPLLPVEDILADIQEAGFKMLADCDYRQYEVSAYARAGRESRHNQNYWRFGDYIGIGAGAHGKITQIAEQHIVRTAKTRQPEHYITHENGFNAGRERLAAKQLPMEFMMNALRLNAPLSLSLFEERCGLDREILNCTLNDLCKQSLLKVERDIVSLTPMGMRYLNNVISAFE